MNLSRMFVGAVMLAGMFGAIPANGQTVTVVSGNGQIICQICGSSQQMVVKVTNANGAPQANVAVNWNLPSGSFGGQLLAGQTTTTDGNGITSNVFAGFVVNGSLTQPVIYYTVTATAGSSTATFQLTQGLSVVDPSGLLLSPINLTLGDYMQSLLAGAPLSGPAGSTGPTPIQVLVRSLIGPLQNNGSVQLVNLQDPTTGPVLNCATGAGAPANTVFTDPTGAASCTPVFGGVPGQGQAYLLVGFGGAVPADVNGPLTTNTFLRTNTFRFTVTAPPAGLIKIISGNNQNANPGQSGLQLVVEVDTAAGTPIPGQQVNWAIAQGAASITSQSNTTDVNGRSSATITAGGTASGQIKVTATLASDSTKSVTFTINVIPPITVTGLQIVSGNNQSAAPNAAFGQPLVVQVMASNGQPAAGVFVNFSVNGPATLSANGSTTDSNGRASVTVQAGATTGAVTVTASNGNFSQAFNLTVAPLVTITANSFVNAADFQLGSLSPCSLAAVIAPGLAPGIQGIVAPVYVGAWSYQVANDKITVNNSQAPIFSVSNVGGQEQITFQVPCDVAPGDSSITVTVGSGSRQVTVPIRPASPGVFQTVMSDGQRGAVLLRPDGSFVSLENPARRGENLVAFVTGMGPTTLTTTLATNQLPPPNAVANATGTVIPGMNGGGVPFNYARLSADLLGVFEVSFQIPSDMATGNNVGFSVGVIAPGASTPNYSSLIRVPVQ